MTDAALPLRPDAASVERPESQSTLTRVVHYTGMRMIAMLITILIGVYLTIIIANMGGHVDNIRKGYIRETVAIATGQSEEFRNMTAEERREHIDKLVALQEKRMGLDQPFLLRSFRFLWGAMTLDLGWADNMSSDSGSRQVRNIILERLPATLLLFSTSFFMLFFVGIFVALYLSRNYGSRLDRLIIGLAPTSAAPSWFYGLFFILLFAALLGWFPFGGLVSAPPPESIINYALSVLNHMVLPVIAIFFSAIFLGIYGWRTFFLIFSNEDYVDMARAKGLSDRVVERRYIMRPTMPSIVTGLALSIIGLWFGSIVLETIFNWPGLGRLFYLASNIFETSVIVGSTVIYAYLLGITVFFLDIVYALIDPRVKVGGNPGGQV
ncbi:MAG: ABC transporter permease [Caldilineaceae bacterium SB0661_bin_32]|uniref:ABC transporter permease n=1 Tax=Caldilineaceae bacterium SB0661_bin_32 TaxID=2605255 RepID=A0A6B1DAR1_9CHLR|nr:ABC transporter permease [Caldilineaceae bacterium SB0661_bin_32]